MQEGVGGGVEVSLKKQGKDELLPHDAVTSEMPPSRDGRAPLEASAESPAREHV